ncbi:hypothetical protein KG892_04975 [Vermiphilus pyriformis]|nr:MAG: hypothetical protein KG892_04975 [Vermiphilus pyriformis]
MNKFKIRFMATPSSLTLKIVSGCLAYSIWSLTSSFQPYSVSCMVPVCFYQDTEVGQISAPEFVNVTLVGTRAHLVGIDFDALAFHVDAHTITTDMPILLTRNHLFIPTQIQIKSIEPAYISVNLSPTNSQDDASCAY